MKFKAITLLQFILLINSINLYSQITITEIEKIEEKIVLKPEPYDSLKNWETKERLADYKQYIGVQVYLPPYNNPEYGSNKIEIPFMYSLAPILIDIDTTNEYLKLEKWWRPISKNGNGWKTICFDQIYTLVYKPYHYSSSDTNVRLSNNSSEVSNKYYIVLNVIYGNELNTLLSKLDSTLYIKDIEINKILKQLDDSLFIDFNSKIWENNPQKIYVNRSEEFLGYYKPDFVFLLKDVVTGDSIISTNIERFILVPYFVKQKNIYLNKKIIYDEFTQVTKDYSYLNPTREEIDPRFVVNYEDDFGNEKTKGKQVLIEPLSKWTCIDVTLLKPTYSIYYILENDKDEQVALTELNGFILESVYNQREYNKTLQKQQLLEKQNQEKLLREEREREEREKHKEECIRMFGEQNGILIAQGKVKINMTQDMCKFAWGKPLWTTKTTTEHSIYEDWYYWLGYSLHFENGLLKRIEE